MQLQLPKDTEGRDRVVIDFKVVMGLGDDHDHEDGHELKR